MRGRFQEEIEHLMDQVRNMGVQLEETLDACIDNVADKADKDVYIDNNIIAKDDEFDNAERVADHATNIAEWVIYIIRNELK